MPTSMSLAQATESFPLDFSKIMEARTEAEYETAVHDSIRSQLQSANLISPTSNITNFNLEPEDDRSWFDSMRRTIMKNNPAVFDDPSEGDKESYLQRRFEFISDHEGWRNKVYEDTRGFRTVGYGFNLEEPTNRTLYKNVLNKTDEDFDNLREGRTTLSNRDGRILFEAAAGSAERLISNKFSDVDLKGFERLALVSLAYNSPSLIGPNLTQHIKAGDRKAAFEEIKFRSNARKTRGIQNRRDLEAQMFSGMDPDDAQDSTWSLSNVFGMASAQAGELRSSDSLVSQGRDIRKGTWVDNLIDTINPISPAAAGTIDAKMTLPDNPKNIEEGNSWLDETWDFLSEPENILDYIKDKSETLGAAVAQKFVSAVTPTDSSEMLISDWILKNKMNIPVDKLLLTEKDLKIRNITALREIVRGALAKGKRSLTWSDYGDDLLGNPISGIIGGSGVSKSDSAYPKTLGGIAKLGMMTMIDSKVDTALTIGQASLQIAEDGDVILTDQYDAEKFIYGSRSKGAYGAARNYLGKEGRLTTEGGKRGAIRWRINLGAIGPDETEVASR